MAVCRQGRDDCMQLNIKHNNVTPSFSNVALKLRILLTINSVGVKVYIIMIYMLQ